GPVRATAITAMLLLGVAGGWGITMLNQQGAGKNAADQIALLDNWNDDSAAMADTAYTPPSSSSLAARQENEPIGSGQQQFAETIEQALSEEPETSEDEPA